MQSSPPPAAVSLRARMEPQPAPFTEGPLVWPRRHPAPYVDIYNKGAYACWWTSDDRQGPGWWRCPFGMPGDVYQGLKILSTSVEHTPEGWFWVAEAKAKEGTRNA